MDVVDEIVIVDGNSSDNTVKICREYTDLVFSRKPKGFADPDRNYALSKASGDWILYIDSDEWLSRNLRDSLRRLVATEDVDAFSFCRVNHFLSRPLLHGLAYPDTQTRLYRRDRTCYAGIVHEQPMVSGKVVDTTFDILHEQRDASTLLSERYVRYGMIYAHQHPLERRRWYYLVRAAKNSGRIMLFYYFRKKGYLDGLCGFVWHLRVAIEYFLRSFCMALLSEPQRRWPLKRVFL